MAEEAQHSLPSWLQQLFTRVCIRGQRVHTPKHKYTHTHTYTELVGWFPPPGVCFLVRLLFVLSDSDSPQRVACVNTTDLVMRLDMTQRILMIISHTLTHSHSHINIFEQHSNVFVLLKEEKLEPD